MLHNQNAVSRAENEQCVSFTRYHRIPCSHPGVGMALTDRYSGMTEAVHRDQWVEAGLPLAFGPGLPDIGEETRKVSRRS